MTLPMRWVHDEYMLPTKPVACEQCVPVIPLADIEPLFDEARAALEAGTTLLAKSPYRTDPQLAALYSQFKTVLAKMIPPQEEPCR